jgi:hypothetical protein
VINDFSEIVIAVKTIRKGLLYFLPFLAAFGCARGTILEKKDVQFFKIQELRDGTKPTLHISGLAFSSAMSVNKIVTKRDGTAIVVLIYLFMARPGTSGSFQYDLAVPESVTEVRFGNDSTVIWKRKP